MRKEQAVASLGQQSLLLPAWVKAALAANDRLKLYLTLLQSAAQHAAAPDTAVPDWGRELAHAGLQDAAWLPELVKSAYFDDGRLVMRHQDKLLAALAADLATMARPVCDSGRACPPELTARRDFWLQRLRELDTDEGLERAALAQLTHGDRKAGDSLHLLVMDLHQQLNAMASEIATEDLDGAHVWQIDKQDRPLVSAFMRGLHRTAPLKFSHPGLDTAVTRDGARLLIQNDIGTNDVHVLVITVEGMELRLTYSDLHTARFNFFRGMLEALGFTWTVSEPRTVQGLNAGKPYVLGEARLQADSMQALENALEGVASRIVFVIDWNRARKRLQNFVSKAQAQQLLAKAAQEEWGHVGWLEAGGERLVFHAMQAVDGDAFRIGDRLDEVLGEAAAAEYLLELLRIASTMLRQQQPMALIDDEARMLLARVLRQRSFEFDLLAEHAAYTHAIALGLCEAIESGAGAEAAARTNLAARAKYWERQADHLLMDARQRAERHGRWQPVVELLEKSDDVADALEEAMFVHSMLFVAPLDGLPAAVNEVLTHLADTTLAAIQDQVKAVEIARHVSDRGDPIDSEQFLQTLWRMLRAERMCDQLAREARAAIVGALHAAPVSLQLATELAGTMEKATDSLLAAGYALRQMVLTKTEVAS